MTRLTLLITTFLLIASASSTAQNTDESYRLIFQDEFNGKNGSQPDDRYWTRTRRGPSTWDKNFSPIERTGEIRNGKLVLRGLPNRYDPDDNALLLTGGFKTQDKFAFQYGKVEVRLKTRNRIGNFPAVWLMPQPPCDGWPTGGEIDIFETIDQRNTSYHTIHTSRYDGQKTNDNHQQKGFTKTLRTDKWHIYGIEWTPTYITFFVDGEAVGTYQKSDNPDELAAGQWPFDKAFYIIVNQAVGDGTWAQPADVHTKFQTQIDWIRVWKKE